MYIFLSNPLFFRGDLEQIYRRGVNHLTAQIFQFLQIDLWVY